MKTKLNRLLSLMLAVLMVVTMFITPVIATDEGVAPAMQDEIPAVQEEEPAQTEESVEEPAPEVDETPAGEISDGMEADTVASEKSGEETYVAKIGEVGYASLAEAIANAKNDDIIVLLKDCDEKVTVVQAPDVKITIDGNGKTYTGTITVDGRSKTYTTAGLTIQNLNFVTDQEVVFINLGVSGDNNTRYICNLTVSGCTFTGTGNKAVGIKSYTGGDKNLTITNCSATGMHSLAQLKNVAGVEVSECNVSGKNGISLGASSDVEISKCKMALTGYGVRADAIEDGAGATITDCKVEANIPVVIRNATEDYALTVNGTNEMIANNEDKLWCAIGIEEYGDYETLTPATGNIQVTVNDPGLNSTGVYSPVSGLAGTGTEEDPYLIGNYNELVWFRNNVNTYTSDGSNQYKGKYVKLTADIDLAGINWTPIGTNSVGDHMAFLGTFDGDGHTISNLYVNADGDHLGFFARTGSYNEAEKATVKNLKFHNVDVSSNGTDHRTAVHGDYVGGVIANAGGNSVVSNVTVTGDVYIVGCGYVGGIVGHGYPDMDNCHVTAEDGSYLRCYYWCGGGIIGYAGEGGTVIIDCSVSGLDIWTAYGAGGSIAGLLQDGNKVDKVSASNVDITTDSDYCMGYIAGNGECSTITNATVNNVTVSVDDEEITPADAVASVDGVIYFNLSEAIAAGGTVTLLRDVTLTSTLKILTGAKVVLDLNGHVLDGTGNVRIAIASYGDLTVKDSSAEQTGVIKAGIGTAGNAVNICGGTFTLESGAIYSLNNAILIDEEAATVNIKGGSITAEPNTKNSAVMYVSSTSNSVINITGGEVVGYNGILLWNNTTINMTGGSIAAQGSLGIQGNGANDNTEINISGDAEVSGHYAAIYHPQDGKLNISGDATLTGWTGVVVKGGDINISGGTISGTGEAAAYQPVSSGFVDTGDGLYIEHYDNSTNSGNYGTPTVTITGGTFTSANAKAVASYANPKNDVKALTGFVSGGIFSDAGVVGLLAEGCSITYSNGTYVVKVEPVAIVGGKTYTDLQDAIDNANGNIVYLLKNVTIGEPLTIGETVTLDGNGYTLTYTGSNRAIDVNNADSDADLTIMNLTVDCTASYCQRGINYNDSGKLTLTNVTVKGTNVTYALNLPSSSDNAVVEINDSDLTGCIALNLWGEKTTVTATDCVFTSVDKSTAENYDAIALNDDGAGSTAKGSTVTINGGKIIARDQDGDPSVAVSNATDSTVNISATTEVVGEVKQVVAIVYFEGTNDFYGCYTLQEALNCMTEDNGSGIRLINDIELTESVSVKGKVVLDLNGKTISGTDNATGSYGLINIQPGADLTVNDSAGGGKITLSATNDRDFNSYSSVISNQQGKLTVNGGTIEHLGGTDMAYGIDNLTNGKGTYAETVINGGTVKSPYRAVRQFLNGIEAQNILTVNGGTIEGANKSIWMQDPSKNPNSGTLTVSENATLKGDVYLFVTLGSTEWPVDVAIAAAALDGDSEVVTGNIPEQYLVENQGGIYGKVDNPAYDKVAAVTNTEGTTYYDTLNAAYNAAQAGDTIELLTDVKLTGKLTISKAITIDGNGYSIIAEHTSFILETSSDCTIKNVVLDTNNKAKGVKVASGKVVFDTVSIPNSNKSDAITVNGTLTLKNYLKVGTNYTVIDARNGVVNAESGTVFDIANWRANASPSKCDLKGVVDAEGKPFFCAYSSTTYYSDSSKITSISGLTLLDDVTISKDTSASGTLNLNGYDLTVAEGKYINVSNKLTVTGDGTVTGAFKLTKETATLTGLEGLKVESSVDGYKAVYENGTYILAKIYAITVAATENGTVTADKAKAAIGETVTLTVTPAEGYVMDTVKVNGEAITGNTFKMSAKDAVIEATFKKNVYGITVKAAENGTVTADKAKAAIDETVTLTVTPAEDYVVDSVKVNGEAITGNTFKMPAKDAVIEATFKKNVYGITVKAAENGTVTADKAKAAIGETVTLTVTPAEGYELDSIKVNGEAITGNTFVMTGVETTVEATFKKIVVAVDTVTRIYGADRYKTAFEVADALKESLGIEKFENIVVACGTNFADALSGSYLANQKNAPILLVRNRNQEINAVKEYIKANLASGGTVYLLGGEKAMPKAMESGLDGFVVKRLAGATRYETNLEILKEAGVAGQDILVCTGKEYADGLSVSAVNKPVLLVKDNLNNAQKKFLSGLSGNKIYVIGGTNAVSAKTENALKAYGTVTRIGGATRYDTSVNVAKAFFPNASSAVLAYGKNFPDGLSGGALAYSMNAPLILTANDKQPQAKGYATTAGIKSGVVLGGPTLISDSVVKEIFSMGDNDKVVVK